MSTKNQTPTFDLAHEALCAARNFAEHGTPNVEAWTRARNLWASLRAKLRKGMELGLTDPNNLMAGCTDAIEECDEHLKAIREDA